METPILFPVKPDDFYEKIRIVIDETISRKLSEQPLQIQPTPNGLTNHPLLSLKDVCALFKISKPTLYDWISHHKLKPYKIRGKVYFLQADIQSLFDGIALANKSVEACNQK
jgi:excisionase family DNA binding protein